LGLAAAILAWMGLRQIASSQGRLAGRPLALLGLFLGLLTAVLQGAAVIGALMNFSALKVHLIPAVETFLAASEVGDYPKARGLLSAEASGISDDRLAFFHANLTRHEGDIREVDASIQTVIRGIEAMRDLQVPANTPAPDARPLPLDLMGNQLTLAYIFVNQDAVNSNAVLLDDIMILRADGTALTLREDGPAATMAAYLNHRPVTP
ncbi:MAG: hypothetical protein KDA21_02205, partial [Phycisphaerales bacterium]|nr:hypothetical protein [Phycisphaerales bacterium]